MKILFAAPDRDLLECYAKLLKEDYGETVTAFDGAQALSLLHSEDFDILLLDRAIPRIDYKTILSKAHDKNIPVILLVNGLPGAEPFADGLRGARLSYPFDHAMLCAAMDGAGIKKRAEKGIEAVTEDD